MDALSAAEARRIALAAQGFDRPRPAGGATRPSCSATRSGSAGMVTLRPAMSVTVRGYRVAGPGAASAGASQHPASQQPTSEAATRANSFMAYP